MHILVTNDDGVQAPGLLALAQAMRRLGRVTVFAPDRNWSASGHVKTLDRPIRVSETMLADGTTAFMSDGAPSDCVALPLLGFVDHVDLVVSGINPYSNIGHDVTYSGTVTAAMEAVISGVPGIAFSLASQDKPSNTPTDYGPAAEIAERVVRTVIEQGLMEGVVLNVNIPYLSLEAIKGIMITRQGLRVYRDALDKRIDPRGRPYYWIGGEAPTGVNEEGTDVGALAAGYVSITPLQLDLTHYKAMEVLKQWKF
ncbi:MAG TPA: 5'/3'-nucleotidase SurE [Anaerolineales bacterium]|nr:5'/3'-nucleotidase SurE [Anaerolineales bacterium]